MLRWVTFGKFDKLEPVLCQALVSEEYIEIGVMLNDSQYNLIERAGIMSSFIH